MIPRQASSSMQRWACQEVRRRLHRHVRCTPPLECRWPSATTPRLRGPSMSIGAHGVRPTKLSELSGRTMRVSSKMLSNRSIAQSAHTPAPMVPMNAAIRNGILQQLEEARVGGHWQNVMPTLQRAMSDQSARKAVDVGVCNAAMRALGVRGKWRVTLDLLALMEKEGVQRDASTLMSAIVGCEKGSQPDQALRLFREMQAEGMAVRAEQYNTVLKSFACRYRWETACSLLREMQTEGSLVRPDRKCYNSVILACQGNDGCQEAMSLFEEMQNAHDTELKPDFATYTAMLQVFAKQLKGQEASYLLRKMPERGLYPDVGSYNLAIQANRDSQQAVSIFREMQQHNGVVPDIASYNAAIASCSRTKDWALAIRLLREAQAPIVPVTPTPWTYILVLEACCSCSEWKRALDVFREAERKDSRIKRNRQALSLVAQAMLNTCGFEDLLISLKQLQTEDGHGYSLEATFRSLARGPEWDQAVHFARDMMRDGGGGGGVPNGVICVEALVACIENRQWDRAVEFVEEIPSKWLATLSYPDVRRVITQLVPDAPWRTTIRILHATRPVRTPENAADTYHLVIASYQARGDWDSIGNLLVAMQADSRTVASMPGMMTKIWTNIMSTIGRDGNWKKVLDTLKASQSANSAALGIGVYVRILRWLSDNNQHEAVLEVFDNMRREGSGLVPDIACYRIAFNSSAKLGADRCVSLMRNSQQSDSYFESPSACYKLAITGCGKAGLWEQAVEILDEMRAEGSPVPPDASTYSRVIRVLGNCDQIDKALALFASMSADGLEPDTSCYIAVANACAASDRWKEALDLVRQSEKLEAVRTTVRMYNAVLAACLKAGQWEVALNLLRELQAEDSRVKPDKWSYYFVMMACNAGGQWEEVVALFEEAERRNPKFSRLLDELPELQRNALKASQERS